MTRRFFLLGAAALAALGITRAPASEPESLARIQSWPLDQEPHGLWSTWQGPISQLADAKRDMLQLTGAVHEAPTVSYGPDQPWAGDDENKEMWRPAPVSGRHGALNFGIKPTREKIADEEREKLRDESMARRARLRSYRGGLVLFGDDVEKQTAMIDSFSDWHAAHTEALRELQASMSRWGS
jgi:hypothetical protein